jgi:uncharacterized membrane protein
MLKPSAIRYVVVPVALVALLVFVMTLGSVWHRHAGGSDANCSICHVTHQPLEQPLLVHREPALATVSCRFEPQELGLAPSPIARRTPTRAPPTV